VRPTALATILLVVASCSKAPERAPEAQPMYLAESVGIETLGGVLTPILAEGLPIPASRSQMFSTAADEQSNIEIHVLAGSTGVAQGARTVGRYEIVDIEPAPRGLPQIEVTFRVNPAGGFSLHSLGHTQGSAVRLLRKEGLDKPLVEIRSE
jgi:molecular chaperone DnaK